MKNFLILLMSICCMFFAGCDVRMDEDVLRIHIRANSNSYYDQNIKLKVRDEVVNFITPLIASCNNCNEVKICLSNNLNKIEDVADKVLKDNGFEYSSNAKIKNEYFPSRDYAGKTFPADFYDALIIELGSGDGDNWWCVAYPPLCFVGYENKNSGNIQYRSKLVEIINNFFGD